MQIEHFIQLLFLWCPEILVDKNIETSTYREPESWTIEIVRSRDIFFGTHPCFPRNCVSGPPRSRQADIEFVLISLHPHQQDGQRGDEGNEEQNIEPAQEEITMAQIFEEAEEEI